MRKDFLVFGKPFIGEADIKEVEDTLRSGWWGTGPKTELFEKKFARFAHSNYTLAVNSATAGLHLALQGLGIGAGDEVITTPLTFCSTANVIIHCGATPVFADVDNSDWNIDPVQIEKKITKRTKALIPVHLHGRPCRMDHIKQIAKKYNLFIIEDAAHAAESSYHGKKIGSISTATVFSFYVTKNIATAEGGMVTTNDKKLAERMRVLSLHGLSRDAYKRYSVKKYRKYECLIPGYKYNMTDIQASLGLHQLARVDKNANIRKKIWETYDTEFKNIPEITGPLPEESDTVHARHLYAILLDLKRLKITRDEFVDKLIKKNIGSGVHFWPVHLHSYYRKTFGFKRGNFPNAEYIGERIVSLPLGANLTEKDVADVIEAVVSIINKYKKDK